VPGFTLSETVSASHRRPEVVKTSVRQQEKIDGPTGYNNHLLTTLAERRSTTGHHQIGEAQ